MQKYFTLFLYPDNINYRVVLGKETSKKPEKYLTEYTVTTEGDVIHSVTISRYDKQRGAYVSQEYTAEKQGGKTVSIGDLHLRIGCKWTDLMANTPAARALLEALHNAYPRDRNADLT